jgi:hypothetical protein
MNNMLTGHDNKNKNNTGYFSRAELNQILNVYARFVSAGEWRDYALDHLDGLAVFSIYRSCVETPIFTIEKHKLKGNNRWQYQLRDRRKLLKTAGRIDAILQTLKTLPRLVHG